MVRGDLAVVERWLDGVNAADRATVLELTDPSIEIVGPRGVGRGRELLADWMMRAGFTAIARRWFCGGDGRIVVEQDATWAMRTGDASRARVASAFVVRGDRIARFQRFDSLEAALASAGLGVENEATRVAS